jgi:hypothetical protein
MAAVPISRTGIGISAGMSNYVGDLDDNFVPRFSTPGFGAHIIHSFSDVVSFRFAYYHGWLSAADSSGEFNEMQARNLGFKSHLDELSLVLRIKLPIFKPHGRRYAFLEPYVFLGAAYFHFNPKAKVDGVWYNLHDLGTEGQYLSYGEHPDPYKLYQWSIPVGGGIERTLNQNWVLGIELGFRKLFTDYLDDVSWYYPSQAQMTEEMGSVAAYLSDPSDRYQYPNGRAGHYMRGNPELNDLYTYTNIHITYYFGSDYRSMKRHRVKNYTKCIR